MKGDNKKEIFSIVFNNFTTLPIIEDKVRTIEDGPEHYINGNFMLSLNTEKRHLVKVYIQIGF